MANETKTPINDLMDQTRGLMAANPMMGPQMEQFWKAQEGILEETEAFTKAWFERRHEAAETALETVKAANGNGSDPASATRSMMEWQQKSFQRMAEDMQQWVELWSRCASRMANAEAVAGQESIEKAEKQAKSAAKTKHATPV